MFLLHIFALQSWVFLVFNCYAVFLSFCLICRLPQWDHDNHGWDGIPYSRIQEWEVHSNLHIGPDGGRIRGCCWSHINVVIVVHWVALIAVSFRLLFFFEWASWRVFVLLGLRRGLVTVKYFVKFNMLEIDWDAASLTLARIAGSYCRIHDSI